MDALLDEPAVVLVLLSLAAALFVIEVALPTAGVAGTLAIVLGVLGVVAIDRQGADWWPLLGPKLAVLLWAVMIARRSRTRDVQVPEQMQRAMARQAEAESERRAKIIAAEGELQASQKLGEAAAVISASPGALQLHQLQTMVEISAESSSTIVFPVPIQLLDALSAMAGQVVDRPSGAFVTQTPSPPPPVEG